MPDTTEPKPDEPSSDSNTMNHEAHDDAETQDAAKATASSVIATDDDSNRAILLEVIFVVVAGIGAAKVLTLLPIPFVQKNLGVFSACLWLYLPICVLMARRAHPDDIGLNMGNIGMSIKWVCILVAGILLPFYILFALYMSQEYGATFEFRMPNNVESLIATHLLAIAIPEEVYFRGYVQGRLGQVTKKRIKILGVPLGWEWIIGAAIFSIVHLIIEPGIMRGLVFFPALAFGWLRTKTGGVLAPSLFHWISNVSFIILQHSLLTIK